MAETLASMKTRVRARADMKNSNFVEDDELTQYINSSYQELYDILVSSFEDYYTLPPVSFSISSGSYYSLPADFYKLRGIDCLIEGDKYYTVQPFNFADRNNFNQNQTILNAAQYQNQYRIVGDRLYVTPEDNATGNYRIWYIPRATLLVDDIDTLDGINGWEEYIVVDAARKCLSKEESDTSFLIAEKEALRQRILSMAARRDAGMPKSITDLRESQLNGYFRSRLF